MHFATLVTCGCLRADFYHICFALTFAASFFSDRYRKFVAGEYFSQVFRFGVDAGIRPDGTERAKCNFNAGLGCKAFELTLGLGPMARNVLSATSLHTALQS